MCTAAGALVFVALCGFKFDLTFFRAVLAGVAGIAGWCFGLWITDHPLLREIINVVTALRRFWPVSRLRLAGAQFTASDSDPITRDRNPAQVFASRTD